MCWQDVEFITDRPPSHSEIYHLDERLNSNNYHFKARAYQFTNLLSQSQSAMIKKRKEFPLLVKTAPLIKGNPPLYRYIDI